jgi:hypothetical protein
MDFVSKNPEGKIVQQKDKYLHYLGKNPLNYDLEKHLVGMKVGEEKDFEYIYPETTPEKSLVGTKLFYSVKMNEIFKLISDLGFPIAAAVAGGYFVYLTIKLLLAGVLSAVKGMAGIITALDNRVKTMNHDVVRIDAVVSNALGLKPDVERIARADGKNDARRD